MSGRRLGLSGAICSPLVGPLAFVFALACGGESVEGDPADGTGGRAQRGGSGGAAGGASATSGGSTSGSGGRPAPDYVEPECPAAPPPAGTRECEPFGDGTDCPLGYACYPYVQHPYGEGCDAQTFGTRCRSVGTGVQGDVCGSGTDGCAAGYLCVIGLQSGRRCAKMCTFDGESGCEAGLICGDTDVEGYGVCG